MGEIEPTKVAELLEKANAAYEGKQSKEVQSLCDQILAIEPENPQAWLLLAKYGAWDSKMYDYDADKIIEYARHSINQTEDALKPEVASEIYVARKHQIALLLEADMMLPSYTGAKKLQTTMFYWQRLLTDIPSLPLDLIEAELTLCDNLCLRSKMSVMPGDRLVYTAYTTLNKKVPYGDAFRKALEPRLKAEAQHNEQRRVAIAKESLELIPEVRARLEEYKATKAPELKELLQADKVKLEAAINEIEALSNLKMYEAQIDELQRKLKELKITKIFKIRDLNTRISENATKILEITEQISPVVDPISELACEIEQALGE